MNYEAVNLQKKFGSFSDRWAPKVIAQMNDYQIKLVRVKGDFVWHDHKETDKECELILIEPAGTVNTGDAGGERTAPTDVWI